MLNTLAEHLLLSLNYCVQQLINKITVYYHKVISIASKVLSKHSQYQVYRYKGCHFTSPYLIETIKWGIGRELQRITNRDIV